jgi:hypothetical protein
MSHTGEISRVQDLINEIDKRKLHTLSHYHVRVWFRGQSNEEWPLWPGVYRPTFPARDESHRIIQERHLNQDFRVLAAGLLKGNESDAELYFLQQHYRMPTRLLDWTTSPLAALYFAVSGNEGVHGSLFLMDAYRLSECQNAEGFSGIATSRNPTFLRALDPIVRWHLPDEFPDYIMAVRPDHAEYRMRVQQSCFTFHVPDRNMLSE